MRGILHWRVHNNQRKQCQQTKIEREKGMISQTSPKQHDVIMPFKSEVINGVKQPDVGTAPVVENLFHRSCQPRLKWRTPTLRGRPQPPQPPRGTTISSASRQ